MVQTHYRLTDRAEHFQPWLAVTSGFSVARPIATSRPRVDRLHVLLAAVALVAACGTDGEAVDGGAAGSATDAGTGGGLGSIDGACDRALRVGGFLIQLEDQFTQVEGQVFDVTDPTPKIELDAADGCRLLETANYFCDPACGSSDACNADGVCVPKPEAVDVGLVTIDGLSAPVTMEAKGGNFYLNLGDLPHPAFDADSEIELRADGGSGEPFTLSGQGSEALDILDPEIEVARDLPVSLSWEAATKPAMTRILVDLDVGHHGGSPATIECDVEDDGELDIPATLVTRLLDFGTAGFPVVSLTRRTVDSAMVGGVCAELMVAPTSVELAVLIDGLDSCSGMDPSECPDGTTCLEDLTCG